MRKKCSSLWSNVAYRTVGREAKLLKKLAGTTGIEPATSCVTGMRSNQLNYVPNKERTALEGNNCKPDKAAPDSGLIKAPTRGLCLLHAACNVLLTALGGRYPDRTDDLLLVRQTL